MFVPDAVTRGRDVQVHVRTEFIAAIAKTVTDRELSQFQAARNRRPDQPTLLKVLRGQAGCVSLDELLEWLMAMGRPGDLRIGRDPNSLAIRPVVLDGRNLAG